MAATWAIIAHTQQTYGNGTAEFFYVFHIIFMLHAYVQMLCEYGNQA